MSATNRLESAYRFLASKRLALVLFALFCLSLLPGTFSEKGHQVNTASRTLLGLLGVNLSLCTARGFRTLPRPVLVMHLGAIAIIVGAMISSLGYIATVNVYEGTAVSTAYRWDRGGDAPLSFDLLVRKITLDYYPVPVRVGVLKGGEKFALKELRTGESFGLDGYTVAVDSLETAAENLKLSVFQEGRLIGRCDTEGSRDLPAGFPFDFKLVAYRNPVLKRAWVDLMLSRGAELLAEGTSEVNSPLVWDGTAFHFTQIERDRYGLRYAGIQIVRDPGTPVVYAGFMAITAGALLWGTRKITGRMRA